MDYVDKQNRGLSLQIIAGVHSRTLSESDYA